MSDSDKLAVLIDADNAQASIVDELLAEIAKYGVANVKRAYGDWTVDTLKGWKEVLHEQAIQPIQQFAYTKGKNATDSALIIDAMDLLYSHTFDGFCLVSSDSDFTRLATRLRESGMTVYGFGERKTPQPFVKSCDKFVYTEVFRQQAGAEAQRQDGVVQKVGTKDLKCDTKLVQAMRTAVEAASNDEGWAMLSTVGGQIGKYWSAFDSRHYGYEKLSELVKAMQLFDMEIEEMESGQKRILIRDKRVAGAKGVGNGAK
ncbi:NYN domain-containing protein [Desulfocurvus sp. DL9XJH121]